MATDQIDRIRAELRSAGVGRIGVHTPEAHEIAKVLHDDEQIGGVIYGRYVGGLAWLIATDKRVVFMDRKPFFSTTDELTYDIVTGTSFNNAGLFHAVTLHTRVADYSIRFVPGKCAHKFIEYIDTRRLEQDGITRLDGGAAFVHTEPAPNIDNNEALAFIKEHDLGVLSTIDRTGNVHGAIVYYVLDQSNFIYIMTKSETEKGRDVYAHSQVALTVHEAGTQQTVQLQGIAKVETDPSIKANVFTEIVKLRTYRGDKQFPPVTKIHNGSYMVIRIRPTSMTYHDYSKMT